MYLIWSFEHGMWWGPMGVGYTKQRAKAGRYGTDEAGRLATRYVLLESIIVHEELANKQGSPKYHPYHGASE